MKKVLLITLLMATGLVACGKRTEIRTEYVKSESPEPKPMMSNSGGDAASVQPKEVSILDFLSDPSCEIQLVGVASGEGEDNAQQRHKVSVKAFLTLHREGGFDLNIVENDSYKDWTGKDQSFEGGFVKMAGWAKEGDYLTLRLDSDLVGYLEIAKSGSGKSYPKLSVKSKDYRGVGLPTEIGLVAEYGPTCFLANEKTDSDNTKQEANKTKDGE